MASIPSMAMTIPTAGQRKLQSESSFVKPLQVKLLQSKKSDDIFAKSNSRRLTSVQASLKDRALTGLTAAALTAYMIIPEVAEAAGSGVSPSLKNFLLSILAGGVVLTVIIGAVIGVSNFDPVKRS